MNELTIGGIRPGVDTLSTALQKHQINLLVKEEQDDGNYSWSDDCYKQDVGITVDSKSKKIAVIHVVKNLQAGINCQKRMPNAWTTSHGLYVGSPAMDVIHAYGPPDSRSPSTKAGQQLELLYYAFDWAGPNVPQVMEVLCTRDKDGKPGQVVEITLAAASL